MGKIVAVVNQKGGVGKTTTAINLSTYIAYLGKDVLLVDIDPQANLTSGLGIDKNQNKSIYNLFIGEQPINELIHPTDVDWLHIIPSSIDLVGAELEIFKSTEKELKLRKSLNSLKSCYDYIFIDCPPSLGILTINALSSCDSVLIPMQAEYYSLEGLTSLLRTIEMVRRKANPQLIIEGVLVVMYDSRLNLAEEVLEEIKKYFGEKIYNTIIPRNVKLAEAPSFGKPIALYDRNSSGAKAYLELAKEFLSRN